MSDPQKRLGDASARSLPVNHALSDGEDIYPKMEVSRTARKYHHLSSSNSDAEIEYRRGRSIREGRKQRDIWGYWPGMISQKPDACMYMLLLCCVWWFCVQKTTWGCLIRPFLWAWFCLVVCPNMMCFVSVCDIIQYIAILQLHLWVLSYSDWWL